MKKRFFLPLLILLLLLTAVVLPHQKADSAQVVHQHESFPPPSDKADGLRSDGSLCTHLPIMILDTRGTQVPGTERSDLRKLSCSYSVVDNQNGVNCSGDVPAQQGRALISIRGNSSRILPKKQYNIRLIAPDGTPSDTPLLGMPAESNWALNGSWIDASGIRNYMLFNLSGQIMDYAPRTRLCEVMLTDTDGTAVYQGLYTLMEKPKVSEKRLDLEPYDPRMTKNSFMVQMNPYHSDVEFSHLFPDNIFARPLHLEYPDSTVLTPDGREYIDQRLMSLERTIYDSLHTRNWNEAWKVLDMDSFVDYFLINEFFQNYDAGAISTYFYQNAGGKIHIGPVWDFDGALNNYQYDIPVTELRMQTSVYYYFLSQSSEFADQCIRRYRELRHSVLSDRYLLEYIENCRTYLKPAAERNAALWYPDGSKSFEADIEKMKAFVVERGAWMDQNFAAFISISE